MKYTVEFADALSEKIERVVKAGHEEYETSHGVICSYRTTYIVMWNDAGEAVGVLNAYTAYAEIYVEDIWVDAGYRRRGIGTQLLKEFETRFRDEGYNNINLVTNGFQAVDFYRKCGFEVEFVRENKIHPKLSKTFLIKYFDEARQTRGIIPANG